MTDQDGCVGCGAKLSAFGVERIRVGGNSGPWKLVFGEWAEVSEGWIELEILACAACRRIEFRVPAGVSPEDSGLVQPETTANDEAPIDPEAKSWNPLSGRPPQ